MQPGTVSNDYFELILNIFMTHWQSYVSASFDIVTSASARVDDELTETLESYLVHLLARNFRNNTIGDKPIAISFMESMSSPGLLKKQQMAAVGDECLFIDGFGYRKNKWPSPKYYRDMGMMAYGTAYIASPPPDPLYVHLEHNFALLSNVLQQVRKISGNE